MHFFHTVGLVAVLGIASIHGFSGFKPSQKYRQTLTLDHADKYVLFWDFNDTHITFEVHVQTHGYVGFGLSEHGNMFPGDVVVGWVKDGHTHFADRHTTGHVAPEIDTHQDWFLLKGEENDFGTMLKFVRKLDTCDSQDISIKVQTMRLIYAYHPDDPTSDDLSSMYHGGVHRGAKSVSLLSTSLPPPQLATEDVKIFEFRNRNLEMPANGTTYMCTGFQMHDMPRHHMVKYEAIFTPGNEPYIHHVNVMRCTGGRFPHLHMKHGSCYYDWPHGWPRCTEVFMGWGSGGGPFYFPEHVGYPIGDEPDRSFFVMQTHFNNPDHRAGVIDNSGIRMTLTSKLRQHDAGTLVVGVNVDKRQIIPAQDPAFVSSGYCMKECFQKSLTQLNLPEVKIFAGMNHAHSLGIAAKTRHFRNGVELEPVLDDPHYDYSLQDIRPLKHERSVQVNDSFITECTYDTSKLTGTSFGGLTSQEEMCITYLFVYPMLPVMICQSTPLWDNYRETGNALHQKFVHMDWSNPATRAEFDAKLAGSTVRHSCIGQFVNATYVTYDYVEKPVAHPYIEPVHNCTA